jgi:hypothetical protein
VACLTAIAAWVAITMIGAYVWPGGEAGGRYAFVIYGAVFFAWLFGYAAWTTRRLQLRARSDLYERLALTPVSADALRASAQAMVLHAFSDGSSRTRAFQVSGRGLAPRA